MYRILFALFVVFALSGAAVACDAQAFVAGYGVQQVVVPSYGVQALNVGYGFGRQQVIVNNHGFNRQAVVVNRGFNRQAVIVGGHRQAVIIQQRPRFSFGFGF